MMSTKQIVEVAGERVLTITERVPGYRAELIGVLVEVLKVQSEGFSEKGRRDKVGRVVEGLGSRVAAKLGKV